jgi:hypothetical protein
MIDLQQVQAELRCARESRVAVEKAECEIEALVYDMQHHAWQRVALADENYDPHLIKQVVPSRH